MRHSLRNYCWLARFATRATRWLLKIVRDLGERALSLRDARRKPRKLLRKYANRAQLRRPPTGPNARGRHENVSRLPHHSPSRFPSIDPDNLTVTVTRLFQGEGEKVLNANFTFGREITRDTLSRIFIEPFTKPFEVSPLGACKFRLVC